jgi:hypothetical protein
VADLRWFLQQQVMDSPQVVAGSQVVVDLLEALLLKLLFQQVELLLWEDLPGRRPVVAVPHLQVLVRVVFLLSEQQDLMVQNGNIWWQFS